MTTTRADGLCGDERTNHRQGKPACGWLLGLLLIAATLLAYQPVDRKQMREAAHHFREALRLKPDWADAMNTLARLLATKSDETLRNGAEAVRWAERACQLSKRQRPAMLDTLAAAYAEAGRFDEAVSTTDGTRALALSTHDAAAAETAAQRLELYKARRPYRDQ